MKTLSRLSVPTLALFGLLLAHAARAEDTKPPAISDVNASKSGSNVNVSAKITDETGVLEASVMWRQQGSGSFEKVALTSKGDDKFVANFKAGGGTIEYYVQAIDELGNGPSKSPQQTLFLSGKKPAPDKVVASNDGASSAPTKKQRGKRRRKSGGSAVASADTPADGAAADAAAPADSGGGDKPAEGDAAATASTDAAAPADAAADAAAPADAAAAGPLAVEHEKPAEAPVGEALALKVKISGGGAVTSAVGWFRKAGEAKFSTKIPLEKKDDDYELTIPPDVAKGTLEYVFIIADDKGGKVTQGDGSASKAYQLSFGKAGAAAAVASGGETPSGGAFVFAHKPMVRPSPGVGSSIRVQATPATEAETPTKAMLLLRDGSGADQLVELQPDETGGIGGFAGQLPAPKEGPLYYQIVACNKDKCAADTGSKKTWHKAVVSNDAEAKLPDDIDAVSGKAPPNLE